MNTYKTINDNEVNDFKKACQKCGLNPDDFEVHEHELTIEDPPEYGLFKGKITLKKNNISRTYNSGHGYHWVSDASRDLEKGVWN